MRDEGSWDLIIVHHIKVNFNNTCVLCAILYVERWWTGEFDFKIERHGSINNLFGLIVVENKLSGIASSILEKIIAAKTNKNCSCGRSIQSPVDLGYLLLRYLYWLNDLKLAF